MRGEPLIHQDLLIPQMWHVCQISSLASKEQHSARIGQRTVYFQDRIEEIQSMERVLQYRLGLRTLGSQGLISIGLWLVRDCKRIRLQTMQIFFQVRCIVNPIQAYRLAHISISLTEQAVSQFHVATDALSFGTILVQSGKYGGQRYVVSVLLKCEKCTVLTAVPRVSES